MGNPPRSGEPARCGDLRGAGRWKVETQTGNIWNASGLLKIEDFSPRNQKQLDVPQIIGSIGSVVRKNASAYYGLLMAAEAPMSAEVRSRPA